MKSIRGARAVCRGICQWLDNLELLHDRTGPSVRHDEWQRLFMLRTNVNEMNVQAIDLGHELRQRVQSCFALAQVVVCAPIAREFSHGRELHAMRSVVDRLLVGTPGRIDALA